MGVAVIPTINPQVCFTSKHTAITKPAAPTWNPSVLLLENPQLATQVSTSKRLRPACLIPIASSADGLLVRSGRSVKSPGDTDHARCIAPLSPLFLQDLGIRCHLVLIHPPSRGESTVAASSQTPPACAGLCIPSIFILGGRIRNGVTHNDPPGAGRCRSRCVCGASGGAAVALAREPPVPRGPCVGLKRSFRPLVPSLVWWEGRKKTGI